MTDENAREPTIGRLPELVAALPPDERDLVERLFQIVSVVGEAVPPPEMEREIVNAFGSVDRVRHQRVVRVMNRWTFEGASFNGLRAHRPGVDTGTPVAEQVRARIAADALHCNGFCQPEQHTPADTFGRVEGKYVRTASNLTKVDGWHGVGIFREHDPLAITQEVVEDIFAVGARWAEHAHAASAQARHFFLYWNCLWRAGASILHGHVQMTLSQDMAQAKVEALCAAAERYRRETGRNYFADLIAAHHALGLVVHDGPGAVRFASLTPIKEREVVHFAGAPPQTPWQDRAKMLAQPLAETLHVMLREYGVLAFNVAISGPPLGGFQEGDTQWRSFPFIARFVDRGNPLSETCDVASMELFGTSVIASDPFDVARRLGGKRTIPFQ